MSSWPDNLIKPQTGPSYAQSGIARTPSSIDNAAKTGDQTSLINAEKWATIMKQNIMESTNPNKSDPDAAPTDIASRDALVVQQIKAELDYNIALNQLSMLLEDAKNIVSDYGDISGQDSYDTNLKQLQLALYKKQMPIGTDVNLTNTHSAGNVDSWVSQALKQTGVGADWAPALKWIINMESSGNPNAKNPNSTAYGLMQFLDNTWDNYGHTKTADPVQQVVAGIDYIKQRYGTADNAKTFWQKNHWY